MESQVTMVNVATMDQEVVQCCFINAFPASITKKKGRFLCAAYTHPIQMGQLITLSL